MINIKNFLFLLIASYFEVSLLSSLVIKKEEDFRMIRSVIEGIKTYDHPIQYYSK